jgi:aminoglycoside phosphotransferase (APT) family kinase protein
MVFGATPQSGFELLTTGHPVSAPLGDLLARVADDPLLCGDGAPAGSRVSIRRDLRAVPEPGGGATIERFSWCAQWREPGPPGRFRARTFVYARGDAAPRTFDFPDDPWLDRAAAPGGPLEDDGVVVLRYIPTRRITFRAGDELVGKIKRPKSLVRSYQRLGVTAAAARNAGLAVPEPRGIDPARGAYYQQLMPGRPVGDVIDAANGEALLRALGATQRTIHELPVAGLPVHDPHEAATVARDDAAWIAFAAPEHAPAMVAVATWLGAELDAAAGDRCFCHGDPAIDQVLVDGDALAVVDFDDAGAGDPYADLGTMLAALPLDAPQLFAGRDAIGERAVAAYLDGYRERAGAALDERRLRAHHARADLALLASRVHKGVAGPAEVAVGVARLQAAARGD